MDKDGSNVKQLNDKESGCRVTDVKMKGKYIYFTELQYDWSQRKCRCKKNGTGKENLTEWFGGVAG